MATTLKELVAEARSRVRETTPEEVKAALDGGELVVVDVREPGEWAQGHVPGSMNVPRGMLELRAASDSPVADETFTANPDVPIVMYCLKSPSARSVLAADTLASLGYTDVAVMAGGLESWRAAGLPVES